MNNHKIKIQPLNNPIPERQLQELREKYNPEGSNLREYQEYMLKVLIDFDKICKKLGIEYWLSSGTVLGAVRHGGFIPWDDDLDVEMTWENYQKFLQIFKPTADYAVQTLENDEAYRFSFAKFRDLNSEISEQLIPYSDDFIYKGAYIDIFYTEYRYKNISAFSYAWFYLALKLDHWIKNTQLKKFALNCCKKIGWKSSLILRQLCKPFPGKIFGIGFGCGFHRQDFNYDDIFPLKDIVFEGHAFPAPGNIDGYLKSIYGESYMQIPSPDKIQTHSVKLIKVRDSAVSPWRKVERE